MKTVGIICEYNPLHLGHVEHIERTRSALGFDCAIVCVMSGNYVQRGDFAIFNKHARAEAAVRCGADLVVEMPSPYSLLSAEGFAAAGVFILDSIGVCDYISFGSECGDIAILLEAAEALVTADADMLVKEGLDKGLPYASAQQKAADAILGTRSVVLKSPNNLLGIEYLKAISVHGSSIQPMTIKRMGGAHDGDTGYSASALRKKMLQCEDPWEFMPSGAADVLKKEIADGRGPVSMKSGEAVMLSRLRNISDFSHLPGAAEGLQHRFSRYAASEPTIIKILDSVKTKRYAMSRLRRMLMCACLGITVSDTLEPPPYIRVLAMNRIGMGLLKAARGKAGLPIITKPAAINKMTGRVVEMFGKEAAATDFYSLAYQEESNRSGGQEWRRTPAIVDS